MNTLITGSSRGIGYTISQYLIKKNHNIINISKTGLKYNDNEKFKTYKCDISDIDKTKNLIEEICKDKKIDNVIFNAGITNDSVFHKMNKKQWVDTINTNYTSIFGVLNPIINQMRDNNNGNIILISSVNANVPVFGQTNYSSSKNALIAFNRCLALENISKNIRCNVISPGYIKTDMTNKIPTDILNKIINEIPAKRFGEKEEICEVIDLLMSNKYITGENININGGLYMN
jgi:NAD(P)-dependent dehydrogenase (short-subunit alcohol dehydrogenase family)